MTDLLSSIRARLRNTLGQQVEAYTDPNGDLRATFPPGRLVVAAGQTISSAWGNTTFDQTLQVFANAGDRTNQWPAPNEGARSWLLDSHTLWVFNGGAWHGQPMGYVASLVGPPTAVSVTVNTTIMSMTATLTAGRKYRLNAYSRGQQLTASATVCFCSVATVDLANFRFWEVGAATVAASAGFYGGGASALVTPVSSGARTFTMVGYTNAGTMSYAANNCEMTLEDIGG